MIGRLRGRVAADDVGGSVLIDVGGVGYEVMTPAGALGRVVSRGANDEVELFIHTHVREDAFDLFGFPSEDERRVFRILIGVPNVGPRTALGVLSALSVADLARAVKQSDVARLTKVPGIGKKTAERLVLELKDKLGDVSPAGAPASPAAGNTAERLLSALTNMGYRPAEAEKAVAGLGQRVDSEPLSDLLREALAKLSS